MGQLKPKRAFAIGSLATIALYALFYLQRGEIVHAHMEEHGAAGVVLAGLALVVLSAVSGLWAVMCRVTTMQAAFTVGLGLPSILASATAEIGTRGEDVQTASMVPLVSFQEAEDGWVRSSLELVISPFRAQARHSERRHQGEVQEFERELGVLRTQEVGLRVSVEQAREDLAEKNRFLMESRELVSERDGEIGLLKVREAELTEEAGSLRGEVGSLQDAAREASERIEEERAAWTQRMEDQEARLKQFQEMEASLPELEREVAFLREKDKAWSSLASGLAKDVGLEVAIASLARTIGKRDESPWVLAAACDVLGQTPRAGGHRDVMEALRRLTRHGDQSVKLAAETALSRIER